MRNSKKRFLVLLLTVFFATYAGMALAADYTVCATGCDYTSIQTAINAASHGDTILVDDGTYFENINFAGKAIRVESKNGAEYEDGTPRTTIDGDNNGTVVEFGSGEGSDSVLSGFTITGGTGKFYGGVKGGGIFCYASSSPRIEYCVITSNSATNGHGGGIACYGAGAAPALYYCEILSNSAKNGGGIAFMGTDPSNNNDTPSLDYCDIESNTATNDGGGIYCWSNSFVTLTNCDIIGNDADHAGGGMWFLYRSNASINRCNIIGNSAVSSGGGIGSYSNLATRTYTITNSTISGNSAHSGGGIFGNSLFIAEITNCIIGGLDAENDGNKANVSAGGGIYCKGNSELTLTRCTVLRNSSANDGGGIQLDQSTAEIIYCNISDNTAVRLGGGLHALNNSATQITNCTIADNGATIGGGLRCANNSSPTIMNNIIYFNEPDQISTSSSDPVVSYSDIENGGVPWPGTGNIDEDPNFVYGSDFCPNDAVYGLLSTSPCIDAGDDIDYDDNDICGVTIPQNNVIDMGAHEYEPE